MFALFYNKPIVCIIFTIELFKNYHACMHGHTVQCPKIGLYVRNICYD